MKNSSRLHEIFSALLIMMKIMDSCCIEFSFGDCPIIINELCSPGHMRFKLLAKNNGKEVESYNLDPFQPKIRAVDLERPLKVIIHGYGGISIDIGTSSVVETYLDIGYNVIFVDWEPLSTMPCYAGAYINSWHVGQCVAVLIVSLIPLGITPNNLHLVGFSLGAHIAGFAGTHIKKVTRIPIGRITGLDPALPFFATLNYAWKLDSGDAVFVDVIHTSAGFFGKIEPTGHADFYINGGSIQPACLNKRYPPICSHIMAGLYFAESIQDAGLAFFGTECESLHHYLTGTCSSRKMAEMGEFVDRTTRGIYFVDTADEKPFALGLKHYEHKIYRSIKIVT